jgi:hypothetical protein
MDAQSSMADEADDRQSSAQLLLPAVTAFRRAAEDHAKNASDGFLRRFPRGTCKAASMLLARYLNESGFGEAELVANGDRGNEQAWETHAWLHLNGLLIDITADQFGEPPVIVTDVSPFHDGFRGQQRYPYANYMRFNPEYEQDHLVIYRDVVGRIEGGVEPGDAA